MLQVVTPISFLKMLFCIMLTEIREIRVQKSTFNIIFLGSHRSHGLTQIS